MSEPTNHMGRPRRNDVPREKRTCRIHGETDHAKYKNSRHWACMACKRDEAALRRAEKGVNVRSFETRERLDIQAKKSGKQCPGCWTELPLSGECGTCD